MLLLFNAFAEHCVQDRCFHAVSEPKSYANSSPCFLVATCCQTHSQVYADRLQNCALWNSRPTFLFRIDDASRFSRRNIYVGAFLFCFLFSSLVLWLLLALVGFCWLSDLVSLRFWLLVWFLCFGLSWLFYLPRLALVPYTPFCWNYIYSCSLHITLHRHNIDYTETAQKLH